MEVSIIFHIVVVYIVSLLIQAAPLWHIMRSRRLQQYFVYAVANSGFLFLNLIGTISVNVTGYRLLGFHYANLVISLSFAITYWVLLRMKRSAAYVPLQERFAVSAANPTAYIWYIVVLFAAHLFCIVLFSNLGAKPLVFRFDLFGDWGLLVNERIQIVQNPAFYWLSLGIFETPLFITLLSTIFLLLRRYASSGTPQLHWKRVVWVITIYSLFISVIYLNKQYLIYLLASIVLCHIVTANKLPIAKLSIVSAASLVALFLLYKIYAGAVSTAYIFQTIAHRIFEVYAWAGAVAFNLYPRQMDFLHGTSIVNPKGILPYEQVIVADQIYPYIYDAEGYGNAPLPAIYENYVNFGWWGILSGIVIVSVSILALTLLSWRKDLFQFVLSLFLTIKTLLLWQAPFWFGLIDPILTVMIILLVGLKYAVFFVWRSPSQRVDRSQ